MTSSLSGDQLVLLLIKFENLTNQVPVYNELYAELINSVIFVVGFIFLASKLSKLVLYKDDNNENSIKRIFYHKK